MLSYLIVGSGYRAEYYARIARKYPGLFKALFLCRSQEKADALKARTLVDAVTSEDAALLFRPDFVVVAVDREHVGEVTAHWAERGFPVMAETPVGAYMEQLARLWKMYEKGAKITCAEQYHRYPILSAGLRCVEEGLIGTPASAYLSLAHEYHGFSLLSRMLRSCGEKYSLTAFRQVSAVAATDSRYGAILDGSSARDERDTAFLRFASGKTAIYDFGSVQYRTFLRSRHLTLRGDKGEWSDRIIAYLGGDNLPERHFLMPEIPEKYRPLDTQALRDGRKTWTGELFLDTEQDEFAIASMLLDMGDNIGGGSSPYPLRDALDDARFALLLKRALDEPETWIASGETPWDE